MKKSLLKTSLICVGITLLCGLYSFKISEGVKSQQNYQAVSIVYDTIITPEEDDSQCIKEVVVEGDKDGCTCTLYVRNYTESGNWELWLEKSCFGETVPTVQVTYEYKLYSVNFENGSSEEFVNSSSKKIRCTVDFLGIYKNKRICEGDLSQSVCVPVSLEACFKQ